MVRRLYDYSTSYPWPQEWLEQIADIYEPQALTAEALAEPETMTAQITFQLIEQDGQWWVLPDQALLDVLSGGRN